MENLQRMENYCSLVIRLEKGEFDTVHEEELSRSRASSLATVTRSHVPSFRGDDMASIDSADNGGTSAAGTASGLQDEVNETLPDPEYADAAVPDESHSPTFSTKERDNEDTSVGSRGDACEFLDKTVMQKAQEHDQGNIGRRRKAISRTSTAAALKGSANRRRLSSIMAPAMASGFAAEPTTAGRLSDVTTHLSDSEDTLGKSSENTRLASSLQTAATSCESGVISTNSTGIATSSTPRQMSPSRDLNSTVRVSSMKIWDVIEDDSDESVEDLHDIVKSGVSGPCGPHHVERDSSMKSCEERVRGTLTLNASRTIPPAVWDNDDADEDVQDGFLAIDIERAINDHQQLRESEPTSFDRQLSISQLVASATSTRCEKSKEREQQGAPSPLQQASTCAPTRPHRRGTSIAKRLMSYVSSPKTSSVGGRQHQSNSIDDCASVFGEEDIADIVDVELGLGRGSDITRAWHQNAIAPHRPPLTPAVMLPTTKTNSSYLRDCLEIRESSMIGREQAV